MGVNLVIKNTVQTQNEVISKISAKDISKISNFNFLTSKKYFPVIGTPQIQKCSSFMVKYIDLMQNSKKIPERDKALRLCKNMRGYDL